MKFFPRVLLIILCLLCSSTAAEAFTTTTNYTFKLPQVNNAVDQNQWGGELNSNFTALDALLKTASNAVTVSLTTNTTIDATYQNKVILADATSGAFTVTLLPAATAGAGFKITIKKIDSSGNSVTVQGNASENVDLTNTQALSGQNASITLVSDGSNWWIVPFTPQISIANASTSVSGILKLADNATTKAGSDSSRAITPASLASLANSGSLVIGAVTIEWGSDANGAGTGTKTFPTPFSGPAYFVGLTNTIIGAFVTNAGSINSSSFVWLSQSTSSGATSAVPFNWVAIGPT